MEHVAECPTRWITRDLPGLTFQSEVLPAPCLRRSSIVLLFLTGRWFELPHRDISTSDWMGNVSVGRNWLRRFSVFDRRVRFLEIDVTSYLTSEKRSVWSVVLGNGWYNCHTHEVWHFDKASWRDYPKFRFELEMMENCFWSAIALGRLLPEVCCLTGFATANIMMRVSNPQDGACRILTTLTGTGSHNFTCRRHFGQAECAVLPSYGTACSDSNRTYGKPSRCGFWCKPDRVVPNFRSSFNRNTFYHSILRTADFGRQPITTPCGTTRPICS